MKKSMKRLVVFVMVFIVAIFITSTEMVNAKDHMKAIAGTYAATGQINCVYSSSGIFPGFTDALVAYPPSGLQMISALSYFTFNSDGTGDCQRQLVSASAFIVNFGSNPPNVSGGLSDVHFSFTYTIDPDGTTIRITSDGIIVGHSLMGTKPPGANSFVVDKIELIGIFSKDTKSIVISVSEPRISTLRQNTGPNGDGDPINTIYRICTNSEVLLPL